MRKALAYRCRVSSCPEPLWAIFPWSVNHRNDLSFLNTEYLLLEFLYIAILFFLLFGITRMHSSSRVGRTRIPWQLESNQKLTGRVPCPRKTKIARRQTGLQCISQAVLNTQDKDDNELLQVRPEMSWKPRRERFPRAAHLQLLQFHDLIKISPPPNINRMLAWSYPVR